jgi:hypothetical protein
MVACAAASEARDVECSGRVDETKERGLLTGVVLPFIRKGRIRNSTIKQDVLVREIIVCTDLLSLFENSK